MPPRDPSSNAWQAAMAEQIQDIEARVSSQMAGSFWVPLSERGAAPPAPLPPAPFIPSWWGDAPPAAPAPTSRAGMSAASFRELFGADFTAGEIIAVDPEEPEPMPTETSRAYIPRAVRNDWRTPANVLDVVRAALGGTIALDPCASTEHWLSGGDEIGEVLNFHEEDDGLAIDWQAKLLAEAALGETPTTVYVNPPFNQNAKWMAKCAEEAAKGLEIIALLPARVDTRYWHNYCAKATAVAFWRGRIRFVGATSSAPFPCALIYWGPNVARFEAVMEAAGHHVP